MKIKHYRSRDRRERDGDENGKEILKDKTFYCKDKEQVISKRLCTDRTVHVRCKQYTKFICYIQNVNVVRTKQHKYLTQKLYQHTNE